MGGIAGRKEREMRVLGAKKEAPFTWDRYRAYLSPVALHIGAPNRHNCSSSHLLFLPYYLNGYRNMSKKLKDRLRDAPL